MTLVSVIIPTYNRPLLLKRAISSVLNQSYQDLEIIVVDDCSHEDINKIITDLKSEKITCIRHTKNMGGAVARNTGIKNARGTYIAFLDDDDEWLPEKLERQVDILKTLPKSEWGGIYCGFYYVFPTEKYPVRAKQSGNLMKEVLLSEVNICAGSTVVITKEALDKIGLFDESFRRHQDLELMIRFFKNYKLMNVEEPLDCVYGHNLPNAIQLVGIKKLFLVKFRNDILNLGKPIANKVFALHWYEVATYFARDANFLGTLKYSIKSLRYFFLPRKYYKDLIRIFRISLKTKFYHKK